MPGSETYDVFVSHNGLDKPEVERLCRALLEAGLRPWFDKWALAPGDVWMREIERVLEAVPAVLVCVGEHGLSAWHDAERHAAEVRTTSGWAGLVVPVLLRGAPEHVELPLFLRGRQWTDLRLERAWDPEFARLVATLTGRKPHGPWIDEGRSRPYRGLQPFTEIDAEWMFGREQEEAALLGALREGQRFITIVGASGSGKSSLVRAGLVPAVRTGGVDGRQRWHALVVRPGSRPCHALALRLMELRRIIDGLGMDIVGDGDYVDELSERLVASETKLANTADLLLDREDRDEQLLVVVDQFEELFTGSDGRISGGDGPREHAEVFDAGTKLAVEGTALLRNLLYATSVEGGRIHVILTVRADFTGECLAVPELARRMKQVNFALPPMAAEQLREAIWRPALRVGYDVEKALIDVLVKATEDQPGRLPLLQHTLDLLWDARDRSRHRLTYAAYDEHVGSLEQSVATQAEKVLVALVKKSARSEAVARRIFLRLVHLGEGIGDTRRQVPRSELSSNDATDVVLDAFIEARLLVMDTYRGTTGGQTGQTVEIAHEALISRWERLWRWLDESRDALRMRQEVNLASTEWQNGGRLTDDLWRGGRLDRALEAGEVELSTNERTFLEASKAAEAEMLRARDQRQRRLLAGAVGVSVVLCLSLAFAISQYLATKTLADDNAELVLEKDEEARKAEAAAARAEKESAVARAATREEQGARASLLARMAGRELDALALAVKAVGSLDEADAPSAQVVSGLFDVLAHVRRVTLLHGHTAAIGELAWTTDGSRLATASEDGTARLWDGKTGAALAVLRGHTQYVGELAWSADGSRLATAGGDGTVRLWDGETGAALAVLRGHTEAVGELAWTADGMRLATAGMDGTARLWDGKTGAALAALEGHTKEIREVAWAADDWRLATASLDATARLWDGKTGAGLATLEGHTDAVWELAWTADGTRLATASWDGTVRLWDGKTGAVLATLAGHTEAVGELAWTTDGSRLATVSEDGTARLWDGKTGAALAILVGHSKAVGELAWTSDGTRLATASEDGTARLWDGKTGTGLATLEGHTKAVVELAWTADGSRLATASLDGTARLWDGKTGAASATLAGHTKEVRELAWAADGSRLATASGDGTARLWDGRTGAVFVTLEGHTEAIVELAWAADGSRLATASVDGTARLWDGNTGAVLWDGESGEALVALRGHTQDAGESAWTEDGSRLATASGDGTVRLWDGETGEALATLEGHTEPVTAVAWVADGTRLATASEDRTARLWDGKMGKALATLEGHTNAVWEVMWTADGTRLATASLDGTARLWDGETGEALATLEGHTNAVVELAWTADGSRLATASLDGTVRLWLASPRAWLERACEILEGSTGAIALDVETKEICAANRASGH